MVQETSKKNLVLTSEWSHEKRLAFAQKTVQTKKETKRKKELFAIGAKFSADVLSQKRRVKKDGKERRMTVYQLVQERCIEMLLDREHPRIALEMMKFLNQLTEGNPKLYAQINQYTINNGVQKEELPQTAEERKAEFKRLMGEKSEAEEVEVQDD
jgi:hypothetical protein